VKIPVFPFSPSVLHSTDFDVICPSLTQGSFWAMRSVSIFLLFLRKCKTSVEHVADIEKSLRHIAAIIKQKGREILNQYAITLLMSFVHPSLKDLSGLCAPCLFSFFF
jgi:hypothetical protein